MVSSQSWYPYWSNVALRGVKKVLKKELVQTEKVEEKLEELSGCLLSGSLGSFECLSRYFSGDGTSTLAGPMVLLVVLFCILSCLTCDLNIDIYLEEMDDINTMC